MPSKPPSLIRSRAPSSYGVTTRSYASSHPAARYPQLYSGSTYRSAPPRSWKPWIALGVVAVLVCAGLAWFGWQRAQLTTSLEGFADGAVLRPDAAAGTDVRITVDPPSATEKAELTLDDTVITDATVTDGLVTWRLPGDLTAGKHRLALTVDRPLLAGRLTHDWTFTIDGLTPSLQLAPLEAAAIDQPVTLTGTVEPGATVTVNDIAATVQDNTFSIDFPYPPPGMVNVVATDAAGNASVIPVRLAVQQPPTHGVHVRGEDWADPTIREQVYALIAAGQVDAVQLDIKDENGIVSYATGVTLAGDIGAVVPHYDVREALDDLHGRGVRVVGRIVAFRDPILANAAWNRGYKDAVLQDPKTGGMLAAYGGFTNYVDPVVREYNLALATEAAVLGFDDVLWDYLRRPEGAPETMLVPGLGDGLSADHIVSFLAEGQARLRPHGVRQGASVFGIAATRGGSIAQDITAMAHHLDYVSPMLYPSHWNNGEYNVPDPNADPYAIIKASLADFQARTQGMPVALVPWLQDFDDGLEYGPEQVAAQINAARDLGVDGFLLWNPSSRYSTDGLVPLSG